jgi:transcriptional regulator with XRE-family HTH domain
MEKLANRIQWLRKRAGLSQEGFAEALGAVEGVKVTRGAIGNWELGGGISRANLAAIADKFGTPLDWLEFGRGPAPPKGNGGDDMDAVRKLIADKLDEKGLTMKEASKKIDRNETYLSQFLRRGVPTELGERERHELGRLLQISPDDLRGPDNPLPSRLNSQLRHVAQLESAPDGADARPLAADIEELRDRCRVYERALRKIIAEEPNSTAAEIARAALRLFE